MSRALGKLAIAAGAVVGAWLILRRPELKPPTGKLDRAELVRVISHGERVTLDDQVARDGWTIVEFSAEWCPACKQIGPIVQARVDELQSVRLRIVDIGTWESAAARDHEISSLPQLWLYIDGKLVTKDGQRVLQLLE